jgi:hypothetical protein
MKLKSYLIILVSLIIVSSCSDKKKNETNADNPFQNLQKIAFKESALYYDSAKVTKYDAEKLVEYLDKAGYTENKAFILNKTGKTFEFKIPIKKGLDQDQETIVGMKLLASEISNKVFNGSPCDIHLCDDKFNLIRVVLQSELMTPKETKPKEYSSGLNGKYTFASERYLDHADLMNLSKYELRIMRNEIFARYGYIFKTDEMRNYFSNQSWYTPQFDDVTNMLTPIEKANVELIKKYE